MAYKILFLSSWYPNKIDTTIGNFVQRHAEAAALDHDVEVLHVMGDPHQKQKFVYEENTINGIRTLIVYYRHTHNKLTNFNRRMKAYSEGYDRMTEPDLVHANIMHNNMLFARRLQRKNGIPYVVTEHWTALRRVNHSKTSAQIKRIASMIGNSASRILPVSQDLADGLKALRIHTPMTVVPNVVDTALFHPADRKNDAFTFFHISTLKPVKNSDRILQAAKDLMDEGQNIRIIIGGDGDTSILEEIAANSNHQDKIEIIGIQPLEKVAEFMATSDAFVLFSDDENQPCVISEALASGTPVISTNVGGISEFFPDGAGILLDRVDDELLKTAMRDIQSFRTDTQRLSDYAAVHFSPRAIAEEYTRVYTEVLDPKA